MGFAQHDHMVRHRKPPSQTWRTFLDNHVPDIAACDLFTIPTVTFRVLYIFIVLRYDRRQVVHFNVTTNPHAEWTAQQIVNAFPYGESPRFLIRDRDGIYGDYFKERMKGLGIEEVLTAARSPWQNPYCERVIGSIRRECLDHVIVLNERHLHRILSEYFDYYHNSRCHLSLDRNAPVPRNMEPPSAGDVVAIPQVGGLHYRYTRVKPRDCCFELLLLNSAQSLCAEVEKRRFLVSFERLQNSFVTDRLTGFPLISWSFPLG